MDSQNKDWLVRTKRGEILGPYTQSELILELEKKTFSSDDEISPSLGPWVSAQVLMHRHSEDFTQTHTRNETQSLSVGTSSITEDMPEKITSAEKTFAPPKDSVEAAMNKVRAKRQWIPIGLGTLFVGALLVLIMPKGNVSSNLPLRSVGGTMFEQIDAWIQTGQYQLALQKLSEFHQQQQGRENLDYLIPYAALLILEEEAYSRAERLLQEVLNSDKATPKLKALAHHWMGYSLLSKDPLPEAAENHFLDELQYSPKDPAARFNLGRFYLKQRKYSQSLDYFQLAELEVPNLWLVHIYKGRAKVELGSVDEARQSFKTAILSGPDRWLSFIYYSLFLLGNRETDDAKAALRKMLSKDPHYETSSPQPFGFYQEKVHYNEYLKAYLQVMKTAPLADRELGKLYLNHLDDPEMAISYDRWEALCEKEDLWPKVLYLKVLLDDAATPQNLISKALLRLPANLNEFGAYGYVIRAEGKMRSKNFDEALQDFQKALTLDSKSAAARFGLVKLLKQTGRNKEAETELRNLLNIHPNYMPALIASIKS